MLHENSALKSQFWKFSFSSNFFPSSSGFIDTHGSVDNPDTSDDEDEIVNLDGDNDDDGDARGGFIDTNGSGDSPSAPLIILARIGSNYIKPFHQRTHTVTQIFMVLSLCLILEICFPHKKAISKIYP